MKKSTLGRRWPAMVLLILFTGGFMPAGIAGTSAAVLGPAGERSPASMNGPISGHARGQSIQIDFGHVEPGGLKRLGMQLTSVGTGDLEDILVGPMAGADPDLFSIFDDGCSGMTLPPGDSCVIWIDFLPAEYGEFSAQFEIESSDPNSPHVVDLLGVSIEDQIFHDRFQMGGP